MRHNTAWLALAVAAAATTGGVHAQSAASSSSAWASSSAGQSGSSSVAANSSASATSSATSPASTNTGSNPLIPTTISPKCQSFLGYLNADPSVSSCTSPLLSALSSFQPSSSTSSYAASSSEVSTALSNLCSASSCDDGTMRSLLTQFNGNCSVELEAKNDVVLGSYDALYVLTPLRDAVCAQDGSGAYCLMDITSGSMPTTSTSSNVTAVTDSMASTVSGSASGTASSSAPSSSASLVVTSFNSTSLNGTKLVTLATTSTDGYQIDPPAPGSLYIQITKVARRLLRRQNSVASTGVWSSSSKPWSASSSYAASASGSGSSSAASIYPSSSSSTSSNSTSSNATSSNSTDSTSTNAASPNSYSLPSVLPNSETWRTSSLPFLFLSPNMSSTVVCSSCTKSILSSYVAWESRQPYALGLANSPMLGSQGTLWTGVGDKCGSGFLEAIAKQAGQSNLTGGVARTAGGAAAMTLAALVVAAVALLA
ncbi:hypothetical protein JCM1840_000770 [Sporobolomyces johnsonii]